MLASLVNGVDGVNREGLAWNPDQIAEAVIRAEDGDAARDVVAGDGDSPKTE